MSDTAQSVVGRALLNNPSSQLAFLSGFNEFFDILPTTENHVFVDHVMAKARAPSRTRYTHSTHVKHATHVTHIMPATPP